MLPLIPYLGNDISSLRSHSPFIPSSYLVLYPLTPLLPYFFVYYVLICHLRGSHDRRYVTRSSSHLGVISVPLLYRRFCRLLIQLLCSLIGHPLQYLPSLGHMAFILCSLLTRKHLLARISPTRPPFMINICFHFAHCFNLFHLLTFTLN